ncbi:MAG: hypothetical protein GY856_11855 [bacterium]|nr:hypothetical protein [bacterium]
MIAIILFELHYQLKRGVTWVYFLALMGIGFLFSSTGALGSVAGAGKVMSNSPFLIHIGVSTLSLVGVIFTSAIAGAAVLRDFEHKSHELLFTTPIGKASFFGGRFAGAFLVMLVVFTGTPLGLALGFLMPWIDPEKLGPFSLTSYLNPFLVSVVPNVFIAGALFFAIGILTRNLFAVYTQGVALVAAGTMARKLLRQLDSETLVALVDPFGISELKLVTRFWTIAEKNTSLVHLSEMGIANRLLWMGIGVVCLLLALRLFEMTALAASPWRTSKRAAPAVAPRPQARAGAPRAALPEVRRTFGAGAGVRQLLVMTRLYVKDIVTAVPFLAITTIGMFMMVAFASQKFKIYGTTVYPVTYLMLDALGIFVIFLVILTTLYGGELVWRERSLGCAEIHDTLAIPTGLSWWSKLSALMVVHALLLAVLMATGMTMQAVQGYFRFEIGVYVAGLFGQTLPLLFLYSVLTLFIHAVVNSKFVGHLLVIVFYFSSMVLGELGFEHLLYLYAELDLPRYSDLNRFGPDLVPFLWFLAYYSAFALILAVATRLLWVRGIQTDLRSRLRAVRSRLSGNLLATAGVLLIVFAALGSFIFYNTNVLNIYRTSDEALDLQAEYEKTFRSLQERPQPRIAAVSLAVDLYPESGDVETRGTYTLINKTGVPIDEIYTLRDETLEVRRLEIDGESAAEELDATFGLTVHRLAEPLAPGEATTLHFDLAGLTEGFPNGPMPKAVLANGSFVNGRALLPRIGYQDGYELDDEGDRKKRGLEPRDRLPPPDDLAARMNNQISTDADWIDFEAVVSTTADQIAIAPGYLRREWREDGRRYFHYAMDSKILDFYSFLSARYEIRRDRWNDVAIEVYYHPGHEVNIDRMIHAVKRSLDYYTANFGPYQHRQVRILEFPRYETFAQSFPNTIPFSEGFGFIARVGDGVDDIDYPFNVTAHEVAHQWWAHQVIGARVQGVTMLSETLSEYSALMVMEKEYGPDAMRKFLAYELRTYLEGRSQEQQGESPLMLVEGQRYLHYAKGSLVMYALRDYLGEEVVNQALAGFRAEHAFEEPPYATAAMLVDTLRELTPERYAYLITDLFETITLYDNRATGVKVRKRDDGKYGITLTVQAKKLRADELGEETEIPIHDWIDVGVFGHPAYGDEDGGERPLYLEKHLISEPTTELEIVVDEAPLKAGIDPYNKLIDRRPDDNTMEAPKPT